MYFDSNSFNNYASIEILRYNILCDFKKNEMQCDIILRN